MGSIHGAAGAGRKGAFDHIIHITIHEKAHSLSDKWALNGHNQGRIQMNFSKVQN